MIKGAFRLGGDIVEVVVKGNNLMFYDTSTQSMTTIEGLRLSKSGVLKEHPDLKDDKEWQRKARDRLKEHIKKMKTENETIEYIKEELKKYGYEPLTKMRAGHRPQKFK